MTVSESTLESVKEYYGQTLQTSNDLKTNACCTATAIPKNHQAILSRIHPEILDRFYGCGSPIPHALEGCTVLDLGCGSGRDCYLLSKLVGPRGRVIGVDMTEAQLAVARKHEAHQAEVFGFERPNTKFVFAYIEDLALAGIEDDSVDLVVSNCVINLSPQKERVFAEIFRVLKPGGELYFSDVFASRRIPGNLREDPVIRGECLGGALYSQDFRRIMNAVGFLDYRVVETAKITIEDEAIEQKIGMIDFHSLTVRAFKLPLEDRCEDYGQVIYYRGTLPEAPHRFPLDDHHLFETGKPYPVCGNTADMLTRTRYAEHFRLVGDKNTHYGLFQCESPAPSNSDESASAACC